MDLWECSQERRGKEERTFSIYLLAELKCSICRLAATKLIVAWPDPDRFGSEVSPRVRDGPRQHVPLQSPCLHGAPIFCCSRSQHCISGQWPVGHIPCCRQLQCLPPDRVHVLTSSFDRAPKPISGSLPLSWFPPTFRCCNDGNAPGWPQSGGMTPCRSIQHASINVRVPCRRHWENEAELEPCLSLNSLLGRPHAGAVQLCRSVPHQKRPVGLACSRLCMAPILTVRLLKSSRRDVSAGNP